MFVRSKLFVLLTSACVCLLPARAQVHATPWVPFGPDGGDARRIRIDPQDHSHLYLGTANGWIYESHNKGVNWVRLARVGKRDDLVLDAIVVDAENPKRLIVGARVIDNNDGGIFLSKDGGHTWLAQAEMRGQAVRALAQSKSDPKILIAGSLRGIFRSTDGGERWQQISPADSTEIHEIQSVAIDPVDPNVIYAGTWHLPWKTKDGGEHWDRMAGVKDHAIIDDSDVFSIIVDPDSPKVVYLSACSGIYKSTDEGALFDKVQGMPAGARRTLVLLQDPHHPQTVFAGTTEGLWRSDDEGKTGSWNRTTDATTIVNDVSIDLDDPRHVMIATDRGGVLSSDDGGDSFHPSNNGFSARQIVAYKRDAMHPNTLYVGVVNDKDWGGVFQSDNGAVSWTQRSEGLEGRDVFSLGQAPDGTMIAGTSHGIFRLDTGTETWTRVDGIPLPAVAPAEVRAPQLTRPPVPIGRNKYAQRKLTPAQKKAAARQAAARQTGARQTVVRKAAARRSAVAMAAKAPKAPVPPKTFDGSVYGIVTAGRSLLAITSAGLLSSGDDGVSWEPSGPRSSLEWRLIASAKQNVVTAGLHSVQFSADAGLTWSPIKLPEELTQIGAVAVEPSGAVWVGGREGVWVSTDAGNVWTTPKNLYVNTVNNIYYDEPTQRIVVTTGAANSYVFLVNLPKREVQYQDAGWTLRFARPIGDHLIAATLYDGIVVEPRGMMPQFSEAAPAAAGPQVVSPKAKQD